MLANVLIIIACVGAATVFLFGISRTSNAHERKESNDFTGAVVAVIGTTYAVLLAFMLSGVWNMFQQAQINAEQEANDLVNTYRVSGLLPDPGRQTIQELAQRYARQTLDTEFPSMDTDGHDIPPDGGRMINDMWVAAGTVQPHTDSESQALSELMSTLRGLTEHRRIRILQSHEMLPAILWMVLISGGVVTVGAACFFGVPNFRFHLLQVATLSFLISLVLVAIADIDRPYQGDVKVSPEGFQFALRSFDANGQ